MLTTVNCCVKIYNDRSDPYEMRKGQRCFSMSYYRSNIVRRTKLQTTGTIFNKQTQLFAYADDISIVGRSLEAVRDAYLALEAEAAKVGLKINEQKTKYMIAAGNRTILDAWKTVAFCDKNFEGVNEFVYLGALVTPENDVGLEIQPRIQTGTSDKLNDLQDLDPPSPAIRQ
jgi:hypothetical protein